MRRLFSIAACCILFGLTGLIALTVPTVFDGVSHAGAEDAASIESEVHKKYLRLEALMGRLLGALDEPSAGGRLDAALTRSRELKIADRLEQVKELLEEKLYSRALGDEEILEKDLERILLILRGEDPLEDLREKGLELDRISDELERLTRAIDEQGKLNQDTEAASDAGPEAENLSRRQSDLQKKTDAMRRALERLERARQGQGGNRQGQRENTEQRKKQGGQGKDTQKKSAQGSSERNSSRQGGQDSLRRMRARQSLRQASQRMGGASRRLEAGNRRGARQDQDEALAQLQRARQEMAEERERMEEERSARAAAVVLGRLQSMLSETKLIRTETRDLHARTEGEAALTPETVRQEARSLARRARTLQTDADEVVRILEEEGSTLVAPPILRQIMDDLENAAGLLDRGETGETVQRMQGDVEAALEELIEALRPSGRGRRARAGAGGASGSGSGGGARRRTTLITPAMEVRMLASAQRRLRVRTERLSRLDPEDREEQKARVARLEEALGELTARVAREYPIIDQFILGADNEGGDEGEHEAPRKEEAHEDP